MFVKGSRETVVADIPIMIRLYLYCKNRKWRRLEQSKAECDLIITVSATNSATSVMKIGNKI